MANLSQLILPVKDTITGEVTSQTFDLAGSGGHTIKDSTGTSMTQRTNLKFNNATVVDDPTNNTTIVTPDSDPTNFVGTLAEWEALTQAEKDQYNSVDLTDDYYDVTEELEALTAKVNNAPNRYGTAVDIRAYNTSANRYTCPCDGYLRLQAALSTSSAVTAIVIGADGNTGTYSPALSAKFALGNTFNSLFVRRGMQIYITENSQNDGAYFIPLVQQS